MAIGYFVLYLNNLSKVACKGSKVTNHQDKGIRASKVIAQI
jgi:hypothetical protein